MNIIMSKRAADSAQDEKKEYEDILQKLNDNEKTLFKKLVAHESKDYEVKKISRSVGEHVVAIQKQNLHSFKDAGRMYKVAFVVGIFLIAAGFILALSTISSSNMEDTEKIDSEFYKKLTAKINSEAESEEITYDIGITDKDKLKKIGGWVKKVNDGANKNCSTQDKDFIKITDDNKQIIAKFSGDAEKKCLIDAMEANKGDEADNEPNINLITGTMSGIFGVGGIIDITILLFRPARDLQRSRASASQLAMALNEWQFISIWSGKVIGLLYENLKQKQDEQASLKSIKELLTLKENSVTNLIKIIEQTVANESLEGGSSQQTPSTPPKPVEITYDIGITDKDKLKKIGGWVKKVNKGANKNCSAQDKDYIKITENKKQIIATFSGEGKDCLIKVIKTNKDEAEKIDSEFYKKLTSKINE